MEPDFLDQALGPRLHWAPVARPDGRTLRGRHVSLHRLDADIHADALYHASHGDKIDPALWLYMSYGPWDDPDAFRDWVRLNSESTDPLFYAIVPTGGDAAGQATYLRIDESNGVIEIGHIWFAAAIQRSRAATEAIYLLAKHAFDDLGYRRFEWKCHARNERSRRAAERFGFTYEGTFRNAIVQRDRNRDTAWYAIIDQDWPSVRDAFEGWLADDNFDADGKQVRSLSEIRTTL
jgi:RimJ/RimL family protein N-acetyltransferase